MNAQLAKARMFVDSDVDSRVPAPTRRHKPPPLLCERRFEMVIALGDFEGAAKEVIELIRDEDTVGVLDLDNCELSDFRDRFPLDVVEASANQVLIRDWLPVVVNGISFSHRLNPDEYTNYGGVYSTNLDLSVLPKHAGIPVPGPAAFTGQILIDSCYRHDRDVTEFQALVAHELIHAIRMMTFVAPAVQDWKKFQRKILPDASDWFEQRRFIVSAIDNFREIDLELLEMIRFFGEERASVWHSRLFAWRRKSLGAPPASPPPPPGSRSLEPPGIKSMKVEI